MTNRVMYTAKRDGGNQIRVFDPGRDPEPSPDGTRPLLRRRDINPLDGAGLAWSPAPGDDLIPVLLTPGDLSAVTQSLASTRDRWAQAVAAAQAGTHRPQPPAGSEPGRMTIEPTPAGYAAIAGLARQQQARYARLLERLQPIIEAAGLLDEAGSTAASTTTTAVSGVALIGISAAFTPADIETLVITAAEAVHGQPEDLSSRQRELAARAYALLQDSIDD